MRRLLLAVSIVTATAIPSSIAIVGSSSPASAASSVSCTKLSGTITGTVTITKCTPKSSTNKSASALATSIVGSGTLTWTTSGGTTDISVGTPTSPGQGGCKKGNVEYDITGSVTGGTSTYTAAGDDITGRACLKTATGALSLVKGTALTL